MIQNSLALAVGLIAIAGCAGCAGPGRTPAGKPTPPSPTELSTPPAAVSDGLRTQFLLSLRSNTNKASSAILTAWSRSPIGGGSSLLFKIDGTPLELESLDRVSAVDHDASDQEWFTKRYEIGLSALRKLAAATNALARLNLERSFVEGRVSNDTPKTFRPALKGFLEGLGTETTP